MEEHTLREFEKRVPRKLSGPKRDEVTGAWRKRNNEELHNLYASPSRIRMMKKRRIRLAEHIAQMRGKRNVYRILMKI
jgi:hypothetical protein